MRLLGDGEVSYPVHRLYFGAVSWTHELRAACSSATVTEFA